MSNIIQFEYKNPKNPEKFSYKLSPNGNANIYNIATPKKYLKSDFVKYCYFTINGQQQEPLCTKKSSDSENCAKKPEPSQSIIKKLTTVKATDSKISRKLGKDNNTMNNYFLLASFKNIIDILYNKIPASNKISIPNNKKIQSNIKLKKYDYRKNYSIQQGGEIFVIIGIVIFIIVLLGLCYTSKELCIFLWILSWFSGGGSNNTRNPNTNEILKAVGGKNEFLELKDKVLYNSFFELKDNYYIYVRFSKNNLFQTMVEVPFIVQLENPTDAQQFIKTYTLKAKEVASYIQKKISVMASNPQPQQSRPWYKRLRNKASAKVANPAISKIIEKINQQINKYEIIYNDAQPKQNSFL